MGFLRGLLAEMVGLFVDDGRLALHLVGLMALVTAAVRLWGLAPLWGGGLLLAGCIGVMACSLWQRPRQ
ncbi:hypothetical protein [Phaeovulum sp. W22_SRMD_FR3]|uniref:hypothetical protein n=1 Tax=Phaeovulum sp. W22_SRMD_FR3 TaxID=3240274 RepID=UPI003F956274